VTEPHRVLIGFDYLADGIWWVSTKEEQEAATYEEWSRLTRALYGPSGPPAWGDLLSAQVLADLKAWNDAHDHTIVQEEDGEILDGEVLEERGRELAIRVHDELGTGSWEVLHHLGGRVHRVHPNGSWHADTWEQDLLGHAPPDPREIAEEEARILESLREDGQQTSADAPASAQR
jgi:hypothetical protein